MKTTLSASNRPRLGTLDDFLAPEDIVPLPVLSDDEWNTIRRVAGGQLAWRFCTLRNLWVHRGRFASDAFGFAWGGIYRTLLVGSIVATSYRKEGESARRQLATLAAPIVLGEIGMWRGQPAVAIVLSREPNRLDVLVIDAKRFEAVESQSARRQAPQVAPLWPLKTRGSAEGRRTEALSVGGDVVRERQKA